MGEIWFISDMHLGHRLVTISRGFSKLQKEDVTDDEVNDMNERIISNYNSLITNNDIVFNLGDVVFQQKKYLDVLLPRLNGKKKILILGNHEHSDIKKYTPYFHEFYSFYNKFGNIILSHIPIHRSQLEGRFMNHTNVHGHIHIDGEDSLQLNDKKYYNVNCEFHDLKPVHISTIQKYIKEIQQ